MPNPIVQSLREIMTRCGLSYGEVSVISGNSPATVRYVLATGELPGRDSATQRLCDFVHVNAAAQTRADIKFAT